MCVGGVVVQHPAPRRRTVLEGKGCLKSMGSSKGDEEERPLTSLLFSSFLCNTVHLDHDPLFTPNSRILKTLEGAHPTLILFFCFVFFIFVSSSHPRPCTQNVTGTQVCTAPPQASTALDRVSKKKGVRTHSRERACMFCKWRGRRGRHVPSYSMADVPCDGLNFDANAIKH